ERVRMSVGRRKRRTVDASAAQYAVKVDAPQRGGAAVRAGEGVARVAAADVRAERAAMPVAIVREVREGVLGRIVRGAGAIGCGRQRRAVLPPADDLGGEMPSIGQVAARVSLEERVEAVDVLFELPQYDVGAVAPEVAEVVSKQAPVETRPRFETAKAL